MRVWLWYVGCATEVMVLAVCERGYVIVYVIYVMQFGLCYWSFVICGYVILVVCDVKLWCRGHGIGGMVCVVMVCM